MIFISLTSNITVVLFQVSCCIVPVPVLTKRWRQSGCPGTHCTQRGANYLTCSAASTALVLVPKCFYNGKRELSYKRIRFSMDLHDKINVQFNTLLFNIRLYFPCFFILTNFILFQSNRLFFQFFCNIFKFNLLWLLIYVFFKVPKYWNFFNL